MQLEARCAEVVITTANESAICPLAEVAANEGLFITDQHKSAHNPIACPLILGAAREARLGRTEAQTANTAACRGPPPPEPCVSL